MEALNHRWQVVDKDGADKYHLQLIKVDDGTVLLELNIRHKPKGMSIAEFIEFIVETGIVLVDRA